MSQDLSTVEVLVYPRERDGNVWSYGEIGTRFRLHRHVELEVNLVQRGHAVYIIDGKRYRLTRRTLVWLFPGQDHVLVERSPDFLMWLSIWRPELVQASCQHQESAPLKADVPDHTWCRRLSEVDHEKLSDLFQQLVDTHSRIDTLNAGLRYLLFRCFEIYRNSSDEMTGGNIHPAVAKAVRLLRDQNPPPSAPKLAREVGLSPSRLSRLFKAQTDVSLTDFRVRQCLERALKLCDDHNLSLYEVAERAGFGSYAQFHRVFTAHQGCSPTRYRNSVSNGQSQAVLSNKH